MNKRIIFMGTPAIAARCLQALIDINQPPIAVVCQPDRPSGHKKQIIFSEVKNLALSHQIKVLQPLKVKELEDEVKNLKPELILTCAYGQFIPDSILAIPTYGCVNIHASLLPKLRGGAPIHYAIINNEKETGITLMYMVKKMDAGNIIKQFKLLIDAQETTKSLFLKLSDLAYEVVRDNLLMLFNHQLKTIPQDETQVSFAMTLKREDEIINWDQPAFKIDCFVRGLYDKPIATTFYENLPIKIYELKLTNKSSAGIKPGTIVNINNQGIETATLDYNVLIIRLQLPSKTPILVSNLINGKHQFKITGCFKNQ